MGIIICYILSSFLAFQTGASNQHETKKEFNSTAKSAFMKPLSRSHEDVIESNSTLGRTFSRRRKLSARNVDREGIIESGGMEDLSSVEHMQVQFFDDDPVFDIHRIHSREDRFKSKTLYSIDTFYGETNINGSVTSTLTMVKLEDRSGTNLYSGTFTTHDFVYSIKTTERGTIVTSVQANNFDEELHMKREVEYDPKPLIYIGNPISSPIPSPPLFINEGDIVVDIMVIYTRSAMCSFAKLPGTCKWSIQNEEKVFSNIYLNILQLNTSFDQSGVNVSLRLVKVQYTGDEYRDSKYSMQDQLYEIADGEPGWEHVEILRKQYGADIVTMFTGSGESCGIGFIGPKEDSMYSVIREDCASSYLSFAHEIGHNFGCDHNREEAKGDSDNLFAYGYRDPSSEFRTILAYDCDQKFCPRVLRFSNPTTRYGANKPLGNVYTDNARQINLVATKVASFYDTRVPPGFVLNQQNNHESFPFFHQFQPLAVELVFLEKYFGFPCSGVTESSEKCPELLELLKSLLNGALCAGVNVPWTDCTISMNVLPVRTTGMNRKLSSHTNNLRSDRQLKVSTIRSQFVVIGSVQTTIQTSIAVKDDLKEIFESSVKRVLSDKKCILDHLINYGSGSLEKLQDFSLTSLDIPSPSVTGNSCNEDPDDIFVVDSSHAATCGWLQQNTSRGIICRRPYEGSAIQRCPVTCGTCSSASCKDDMTARFRLSGRRSGNCASLSRSSERNEICSAAEVRRTCPSTCMGFCSTANSIGRPNYSSDRRKRIP